MKKFTLPVLLVAIATTALPFCVSAQSFQMYGRLDLGLAYQVINTPNTPIDNDGLDGVHLRQFGMRSGQETGARWGLKGQESLGAGNKAQFVYEVPFTASTSAGRTRARVSTVGLSGNDWGELNIGRRLSASSYALDGIDPMDGSYDTASLQSSMGTYSIRYSNQLWYRTPNLSGLSFALSYSFDTDIKMYYLRNNRTVSVNPNQDMRPGENTFSTQNNNRALSLGMRYEAGPILAAASYDRIFPNQGVMENIPTDSPRAWLMGASYDFKFLKISMAVGQQFDGIIQGGSALSRAGIDGGVTNTQGDILLYPNAKIDAWMIGVTVPLGRGVLTSSFQQARPQGALATEASSQFQNISSVGYSYMFTKRTSAYAYYSYSQDYMFVANGSVSTLGVGLVHRF